MMSFIYDMADTWNNGATTFVGIKLNVLDTASAAGSLLMDLQVGGVSKLKVSKSSVFSLLCGAGESVEINLADRGKILSLFGSAFGSQPLNVFAPGGMVLAVDSASLMFGATADLKLYRDAANTLAQRNGTAPQTKRVYYSYTDLSNRQNAAILTGSDYVEFAAETAGTGADNLDVRLTPAGTGNVRFGSHSALAAETVTGYVTIKDAAGNARKLAVVS